MTLLPLEELPRPLPAAAPGPVPARLLRTALSLLPLLLIGAWAVIDRRSLSDSTARLASADPWWLLAGVAFTLLTWVSAACVRQGALPERLPPGLLLASQFAAGAANHVLPASIGAHAVTLRFLQRQGVPLPRATASLALYSLVRPVAKTVVLIAFVVLSPGLLRPADLIPDGRTLLVPVTAAGLVALTAALLLVFARPVRGFVRTALTDVRLLHTRPSRVLALWGGAAAAPLLQAGVIFSVGAALGLPLTWTQVAFAFLAASTAVGAIPAPGGIGPVDAALVFALVGFGAPTGPATATVVGYRVLTVWVPLLPGALVLSALVQRKVL
ncbi:YbhN family protein [Streptomyces sp. NPDC051913]|uniref:YbhN family protein n=1 Tax=Streptomyces sp. NPDC051913 TaxID=3365676 RepID=UPI0037CEC852